MYERMCTRTYIYIARPSDIHAAHQWIKNTKKQQQKKTTTRKKSRRRGKGGGAEAEVHKVRGRSIFWRWQRRDRKVHSASPSLFVPRGYYECLFVCVRVCVCVGRSSILQKKGKIRKNQARCMLRSRVVVALSILLSVMFFFPHSLSRSLFAADSSTATQLTRLPTRVKMLQPAKAARHTNTHIHKHARTHSHVATLYTSWTCNLSACLANFGARLSKGVSIKRFSDCVC